MFVTANGTALAARNATRAIAQMTHALGLSGVTPHALRHTYASLLIAQGRDPVYVADQLGHASAAVTLRVYAHLFRAAQQERDAREALGDGYGRWLHRDGTRS